MNPSRERGIRKGNIFGHGLAITLFNYWLLYLGNWLFLLFLRDLNSHGWVVYSISKSP
jgi:hypothetical protein